MTALQQIIKEAKILRKKNPKMEWKKAVAQASAIYASKHKGKSPVGKKHKKVARKKAAKKRISGSSDYYTRKKDGRVIPRKTKHKKAAKKKPTERAVLKSIQHAVNVQKSHMGSLHKADHTIITKYKNNIEEIAKQNQYLMQWQYALKQQHTKANKIICRNRINEIKKYISELKIHARELKKLLK